MNNAHMIQGVPAATLASGGGAGTMRDTKGVMIDSSGRLVAAQAPMDLPCYSAFFFALAPAATANDIVILTTTSAKVIKVRRVMVTGVATAAASLQVHFLLRNTLNTAGTTAAATTLGKFDTSMPTVAGSCLKYTANPTAGNLESRAMVQNLGLVAAGAALPAVPIDLFFGIHCPPVTVRTAATDEFAINLNGAAIPAGTALDIIVWWTEEPV